MNGNLRTSAQLGLGKVDRLPDLAQHQSREPALAANPVPEHRERFVGRHHTLPRDVPLPRDLHAAGRMDLDVTVAAPRLGQIDQLAPGVSNIRIGESGVWLALQAATCTSSGNSAHIVCPLV